jgi:hypothetical protein
MAKANYFGVGHVVYISTNIGKGCEHCSTPIRHDEFDRLVNHYIEQHGYKLLHVGAETSHDNEGKPWHSTVAVVGK